MTKYEEKAEKAIIEKFEVLISCLERKEQVDLDLVDYLKHVFSYLKKGEEHPSFRRVGSKVRINFLYPYELDDLVGAARDLGWVVRRGKRNAKVIRHAH